MNHKFDWDQTTKQLIEALGGKKNIKSFFHCATRLRVLVFDDTLVDRSKLASLALVKGVNKEGEQWQVIYGAGTVNKVFDFLTKALSVDSHHSTGLQAKPKTVYWNKQLKWHANLFLLLRMSVRSFAEIFIPLIPIFIVGGLSLAIASLAKTIAQSAGTLETIDYKNTSFFFELIGGAILGSLPVFVGYTAMKKFGGSPMIGMAIGLIMVAPSLINGWSSGSALLNQQVPIGVGGEDTVQALFPNAPKFFSWMLVGYQAQVFPVLLIIAMAAGIERLMTKYTPEAVAILAIPLSTVLLSVFFGFLFVGPIGRYLGYALGWLFQNLFVYTNYTGIGFGGAVFGFAYPFLVVTGLHQGFLPIEAQLIAQTTTEFGHAFTWITPVATVANIAQGIVGLTMAILFVRKKATKQSSVAISGGISANLGITEPILFGVNLPLRYPLMIAAIASAIGGYWLGATHTVANSLGSASWLGMAFQFDYTVTPAFEQYISSNNINAMLTNLPPVANMAIAACLTTMAAFGLTFFFNRLPKYKAITNQFIQNRLA